MKNRKTYIPITLAELTNVTQSFSTSLEQIEYLAVTNLGLQNKLKQNKTNENGGPPKQPSNVHEEVKNEKIAGVLRVPPAGLKVS